MPPAAPSANDRKRRLTDVVNSLERILQCSKCLEKKTSARDLFLERDVRADTRWTGNFVCATCVVDTSERLTMTMADVLVRQCARFKPQDENTTAISVDLGCILFAFRSILAQIQEASVGDAVGPQASIPTSSSLRDSTPLSPMPLEDSETAEPLSFDEIQKREFDRKRKRDASIERNSEYADPPAATSPPTIVMNSERGSHKQGSLGACCEPCLDVEGNDDDSVDSDQLPSTESFFQGSVESQVLPSTEDWDKLLASRGEQKATRPKETSSLVYHPSEIDITCRSPGLARTASCEMRIETSVVTPSTTGKKTPGLRHSESANEDIVNNICQSRSLEKKEELEIECVVEESPFDQSRCVVCRPTLRYILAIAKGLRLKPTGECILRNDIVWGDEITLVRARASVDTEQWSWLKETDWWQSSSSPYQSSIRRRTRGGVLMPYNNFMIITENELPPMTPLSGASGLSHIHVRMILNTFQGIHVINLNKLKHHSFETRGPLVILVPDMHLSEDSHKVVQSLQHLSCLREYKYKTGAPLFRKLDATMKPTVAICVYFSWLVDSILSNRAAPFGPNCLGYFSR